MSEQNPRWVDVLNEQHELIEQAARKQVEFNRLMNIELKPGQSHSISQVMPDVNLIVTLIVERRPVYWEGTTVERALPAVHKVDDSHAVGDVSNESESKGTV